MAKLKVQDMITLVLMFLKKYWKYVAIALLLAALLGALRTHYIHLGEQRAQERYSQMEAQAAQELAALKSKSEADYRKMQTEVAQLTADRNEALDRARKTPTVLTKIVTKVMHEGETCTSNDISPDFERVWNDAAKAGSDKPVP